MAESEPEKKPDAAAQTAELEAAKARTGDLQKEIDRLKKKLDAKDAEEEKAKQAALIEQGKHKELADKFKAELDQLKPELEIYRTAAKAEKEMLLLKLPEDQREKWGKADLELLRDHIQSVTKTDKLPTKPTKPGESREFERFEDMSFDEQETLKKENPLRWKLLFDDRNKRRGLKVA